VAIGDVTKNSDFRCSEFDVLVLRRMLLISSRLPVDLVNFLSDGFFTRFELKSPNVRLATFCIEPFENENSELTLALGPCEGKRTV
jgi:hypothetical protein